jgi:E3 ubiquitin-protein ligase HERC2
MLIQPSSVGADQPKWMWFWRYCVASRVGKALQQRSSALPLPSVFCDDVLKKVEELTADDERVDRSYEDNELFGNEQDEQLLIWLNRFDCLHC